MAIRAKARGAFDHNKVAVPPIQGVLHKAAVRGVVIARAFSAPSTAPFAPPCTSSSSSRSSSGIGGSYCAMLLPPLTLVLERKTWDTHRRA